MVCANNLRHENGKNDTKTLGAIDCIQTCNHDVFFKIFRSLFKIRRPRIEPIRVNNVYRGQKTKKNKIKKQSEGRIIKAIEDKRIPDIKNLIK